MATNDPDPPAPTKKPSSLAVLWQKIGLDTITLVMMAKCGGILPIHCVWKKKKKS